MDKNQKSLLFYIVFLPLNLIFFYSLLRLANIYLWKLWSEESFTKLVSLLLKGLASDFSFFHLALAPFFILLLILSITGKKLYKKLAKTYFYTLNIGLILLWFLDSVFIKTKDYHFNLALLSTVKKEMFTDSFFNLTEYFPFFAFSVLFVSLFTYLFHLKINIKPIKKKKALYVLLLVFTSILSLERMLYKSLDRDQSFVANPIAYRLELSKWFGNHFSGANLKTVFFKDSKELLEMLDLPKHTKRNFKKNQNIFLIVVESLSLEYVIGDKENPSFFPFLKNLGERGLFFKSHFSETRYTEKSVASIFFGTLQGDYKTYVSHMPEKNLLPKGIGNALQKLGYKTVFFFGDKKKSLDLDKISSRAGFQTYITKEDYLKENPNPSHIGQWGDVYEGYFFNFALNRIKSFKSPFFVTILTNYPHIPYDFPNIKKGLTRKEKMIGSMRYVDDSLRDFFQKAKKEPWYKNTLFIITGDHKGQRLDGRAHRYLMKKATVPLILYHPTEDLRQYKSENKLTYHLDIYPTILDYVGLKSSIYYGHSVFDKAFNGRVIFGSKNSEVYVLDKKYLVKFDVRQGKAEFFHKPTNRKLLRAWDLEKEARDYYRNLSKAYVQYSHKGLIGE